MELNLLHHVQSVLELDVARWFGNKIISPDTVFKPEETELDIASYSCRSTSNSVGPGVRSTTRFRVHYPPQNITVNPL